MTNLFSSTRRAKVAAAASAVLLAGMGVTLGASPAHAAKSDCPAGALCVWTQPNYGGTMGKVYGNNNDLTIYYAFNNVKSLYNNGNDCDVTVYTGRNHTGYGMNVDRGDAIPELSVNSVFYNDISSNQWVCPWP